MARGCHRDRVEWRVLARLLDVLACCLMERIRVKGSRTRGE